MSSTVMQTVIIGNSGSGKSTLAQSMAAATQAPVLDLDSVYWEPDAIALRRDPADAAVDVRAFCANNETWIIEGCYADLAAHALEFQPQLIFLHPGLETCLSNCRMRPWEPHKYASKAEQDQYLEPLLAWVVEYYERDGEMSLAGHLALYEAYAGPKSLLTRLPAL
jgi:adenylate kinase family enzyme